MQTAHKKKATQKWKEANFFLWEGGERAKWENNDSENWIKNDFRSFVPFQFTSVNGRMRVSVKAFGIHLIVQWKWTGRHFGFSFCRDGIKKEEKMRSEKRSEELLSALLQKKSLIKKKLTLLRAAKKD